MYWYSTKQGVRYRIYEDLHEFAGSLPKWPRTYNSQYRKWLRIPASFDIETTRIGKRAYMYHWQFALGDQIVLGRTWEQYETMLMYLQQYLTKYGAHLIVWVANLGHEFAFLCKRYEWGKVFARETHQPLTADQGMLQYREALTLSGIGGLLQLSKQYTVTKKAKNDLNYDIQRNSHTPLTDIERGYCIADVAILSEWGEYCFTRWIDGSRKMSRKIPLTATGICRQAVKDSAGDKLDDLKREARLCYPKTAREYNFIMEKLFRGGYTHANVYWADEIVSDVIGADFTSSYPAVMLHYDGYPVGRFFKIQLDTDGRYITDHKLHDLACWMIITFTDIQATSMHDIESMHKIIKCSGESVDNGRLISADSITVALTDLDYQIYCMFYKWKSIKIHAAQGCTRGRLPEYVLKPLLDAYVTKCDLKRQHLDGTPEYRQAKSLVNSFYGMTVQRLSFIDYVWTFDEGWKPKPTKRPYSDLIKDVFLSPFWGIWITSRARYMLLNAVHRLDPDFKHNNVLYCDTDSIYMIASPDNISAIVNYNKEIAEHNNDLPECCDDLGCFDWIDNRKLYRFKTLGAKRYIKLDQDGHPTVTVAGMRDGTYLDSMATDDAPDEAYFTIKREIHHDDGTSEEVTRYVTEYDFFHRFADQLLLSMYISGKTTMLCTEKPYHDIVAGEEMSEMCGAAIYPVPFQIHLKDDYIDLIKAAHDKRRLPVYEF